MPIPPPTYFGMPLERNCALRENPQWIERQVNSANRMVTTVYADANLTSGSGLNFVPLMAKDEQARILIDHAQPIIYLGHQLDCPVFAVDLSHVNRQSVDRLAADIDPAAEFVDLRKSGPILPPDAAAIFAYARGVCFWHRHNRFCSQCGNRHQVRHGGHMLKCTDASCAKEVFPRLDPAVIMIVELMNPADGVPKCLLGRHKGLPAGVYSTLAGYVEIGETLEEAVAREVLEEAGVKISGAQYISSQPWPFPASLMLGYRAQSAQDKLHVDYAELEDARWFSADQIRRFGEYPKNQTMALPRKDSIARTLIESWLAEQA